MSIRNARFTFPAIGLLLCAPLSAQVTQRVSLSSRGVQGNNASFDTSISADGRYVAFSSFARNLVPGDTNGAQAVDVYVRDRHKGITECVSVNSAGTLGNNQSFNPSISGDGRYVAFGSDATNLIPGDTQGYGDIIVRDRRNGTTELVSINSTGVHANGLSAWPSISADGRYVAFVSWADNLVPGDTNGIPDVFIRDRQSGTTESVSVVSGPHQQNHDYWNPYVRISADGRYAAFQTFANNIVPGLQDQRMNVFLSNRQNGHVELINVDPSGVPATGGSYDPSVSTDGRFVAFASYSTSLVPGDTNGTGDIFVRDRSNWTTERVSVDSNGLQANGESGDAWISADGRFVVFMSWADNLVPGDTNGASDIFVHDRRTGTTERVSVDSAGAEGNNFSRRPSISADCRYVAFASEATNLVPGDTTGLWEDVFVRDRLGGTAFTSLCEPGLAGVVRCPCSNPPNGPDRGCDNSSGTGGAVLSASGGTFLSSDSLAFTTSDEKPTALSILTQWTGTNSTGAIFGMGVRCTSGTFRRLYTKAAAGGSITAPNFGAGDPQVSVRSEARGDTILAGQSRWYFVYYRDPIVLGGCPVTSTFNATQTGQVTWSP